MHGVIVIRISSSKINVIVELDWHGTSPPNKSGIFENMKRTKRLIEAVF